MTPDDASESAEVKLLLERGFGAEPPVRVTREDLVTAGKRRLRRQRATAISGVALAAVAVLMVVSAATTGWLNSAPVGPATAVHPTMPTTSQEPSVRARLGEALRTAPIDWPSSITGRTGDVGPHWYDFRYGYVPTSRATGYEASMRLETPTGYRWLTISVFTAPEDEQAPVCIGAQSGEPLPGCTRGDLPDGGTMRVDVEKAADAKFPTIALITVVRADHTKVEVMETSAIDNGARPAQLLSTKSLTILAMLPGFDLG